MRLLELIRQDSEILCEIYSQLLIWPISVTNQPQLNEFISESTFDSVKDYFAMKWLYGHLWWLVDQLHLIVDFIHQSPIYQYLGYKWLLTLDLFFFQ